MKGMGRGDEEEMRIGKKGCFREEGNQTQGYRWYLVAAQRRFKERCLSQSGVCIVLFSLSLSLVLLAKRRAGFWGRLELRYRLSLVPHFVSLLLLAWKGIVALAYLYIGLWVI